MPDLASLDTEVKEEKLDWAAILEGSERGISPLGSESELSEWSTDEEETPLSESHERSEIKRPQLDLVEREAPDEGLDKRQESDTWLRERIQPQYWRQEQALPEIDSEIPAAHFENLLSKALRKAGLPAHTSTKLSEYQLLRECLWMVRHPAPSTIFELDAQTGAFRVGAHICLASASRMAVAHSLSDFCTFVTELKLLRDFVQEVAHADETVVSFTYEAYAAALEASLHWMYSDVLKIEEIVSKQDETFTLLDFLSGLKPWMNRISFLHKIHLRASQPSFSNLALWQKAVLLISGLYHGLQSATNDLAHVELALNLFLRTCLPYFRMINLWLSEGRLEDFRDEFVILKEGEVESQTFWSKGFTCRPYKAILAKHDLEMPPMFEKSFASILISGKSIEILTVLNKKYDTKSKFVASDDKPRDFYQSFVKDIKKGHLRA